RPAGEETAAAASGKGGAPRPATPPAALNAAPNAVTLLKALGRRWLLAASLGVMIALLAASGTFFFMPTPRHTVRTMLRVPPGSHFIFKTSEAVPDLISHQRNQ